MRVNLLKMLAQLSTSMLIIYICVVSPKVAGASRLLDIYDQLLINVTNVFDKK
jgi:hypothetical protein